MTDFKTLHDHFNAGLAFEDAKHRAGFGACSPAIALLLAKYWQLLELEHATASAAVYFDLMLAKEAV